MHVLCFSYGQSFIDPVARGQTLYPIIMGATQKDVGSSVCNYHGLILVGGDPSRLSSHAVFV